MAYKQIGDGEKVKVANNMVLDVACCGCGLIHRIGFSRSVMTRWSLLDKATKRYRKRHAAELPCVLRGK